MTSEESNLCPNGNMDTNLSDDQEGDDVDTQNKGRNRTYQTFLGENDSARRNSSQQISERDKGFLEKSLKTKICVLCIYFVDFSAGTFYSLLAPFFPTEAKAKGISSTVTGLIFSVYPIAYILMSPLFGRYLNKMGAKLVFVAGALLCGISAIFFGCFEYVNDTTTYTTLCILVRALQAIGGVAFTTAMYPMVAFLFPAQMAFMFGFLEVAFGLGAMMGPPIGGWLFEIGGFKLPFIVSGIILLLIGGICVILIPDMQESQTHSRSMLSMLMSPLVWLAGLTGAIGTGGIGFLDVSLALRLHTKFNLTPGWTGLVFFIAPALFILSAPMWGRFADKRPPAAPLAMGGATVIGGIAFWFLGPAPFLHIPDTHLWLLMLVYGIQGVAIGSHVINGVIMIEEASRLGYPKNIETLGMLAGLTISFNSMGSFFGPIIGGYLIDRYQFPGATVIVGIITMLMGSVLFFFTVIRLLLKRRALSNAGEDSTFLLSKVSQDSGAVITPAMQSSISGSSSAPMHLSKENIEASTTSAVRADIDGQGAQDSMRHRKRNLSIPNEDAVNQNNSDAHLPLSHPPQSNTNNNNNSNGTVGHSPDGSTKLLKDNSYSTREESSIHGS